MLKFKIIDNSDFVLEEINFEDEATLFFSCEDKYTCLSEIDENSYDVWAIQDFPKIIQELEELHSHLSSQRDMKNVKKVHKLISDALTMGNVHLLITPF